MLTKKIMDNMDIYSFSCRLIKRTRDTSGIACISPFDARDTSGITDRCNVTLLLFLRAGKEL